MSSDNKQKPFDFLKKVRSVNKKIPLNEKWSYLPSNYAGMCSYCLFPVQKVKGGKSCKACTYKVLEFPKDLLPWRVIPPNVIGNFDLKTFLAALTREIAFKCGACNQSFASAAVFMSLCNHKHLQKIGYPYCRLCCKAVSKSLAKAIDDAIKTRIDVAIFTSKASINSPARYAFNFNYPPADNTFHINNPVIYDIEYEDDFDED